MLFPDREITVRKSTWLWKGQSASIEAWRKAEHEQRLKKDPDASMMSFQETCRVLLQLGLKHEPRNIDLDG